MNYKKEHYPVDISELTKKGFNLSNEVLKRLNDPNCPTIRDLYKGDESPIYSNKVNYKKFWGEANSHLGKATVLKNDKIRPFNEYMGLYIMGATECHKVVPVYVGISRTVCRRLKQHGWGKKHNECSLAYLQTRESKPELDRKTIRDHEMEPAKDQIRDYKVWLLPIESDYEMYFLEVTLAGILKTKWNSFRTH